jgi:hypothetical protein
MTLMRDPRLGSSLLDYIDRTDQGGSFESDVADWLEKDNVVLLGFPGIGKSASAMAIAANCIQRHKEQKYAVVMSISQTEKPSHTIGIIKIKGTSTVIPVPIVAIPPAYCYNNILTIEVQSILFIH